MADVCKAFRMDMRTLRRELPKYTKIRPPGPRPGFKRKPYGHYPKEEVTQNEPDTSRAEPRADLLTKPFDLNEEPVPNREVKQGDPKAGSKPKRKIIPI